MVQLKTEPSSPGTRSPRTGKKASAGAASLLDSLKSSGKDFSSLMAKTEKPNKAEAGALMKESNGKTEKALQSAKSESKRAETRDGKIAERDSGKERKKQFPGTESGVRPEASAIFRELKDFLAAKPLENEGKTGGLGAITSNLAGRAKAADLRALLGQGEKLLQGRAFEAASERTASVPAGKKEDSRKVKDEAGKSEKSSHEIRKEKAKERQKEAAQEKPALERAEVKEVPSLAFDDQKKDGPKDAFEIRVSGKNGVFEKLAEDLRASPDGRETRELSSQILKQLREEGNASVVRSARIILKNQDEGEIRLILKPEKLGEVRIRLHLQDHLIGGHILVENSSVREAFEQNLQDLAAAFRESGFELGNLDVSVGNGGEGRSDGESPRFSSGRNAAELERSVPRVEALKYYASNSVNIMV